MSEHTPGPWKVNPQTFNPERAYSIEASEEVDGEIVAEVLGGGPEDLIKADARLIAAAPELLEAAQECARLAEFTAGDVSTDPQKAEETALTIRTRLREAIATATTEGAVA